MSEETKQSSCCCEGFCIVVKPSGKGCNIQVRICDDANAETSKSKAEGSGDSSSEDCCK